MSSRDNADVKRYAIYFTPAPRTRLWRFGATVLGYDAYTGEMLAAPEHPLFAASDASALVAQPQRYGFHATLKAPFALAEGMTEDDVLRHAAAVASKQAPVAVGHLAVTAIGNFLALRPAGDMIPIDRLAGHCVVALDPLRAPLTAADRARRLAAPLSARQIAHLDKWGYPHVFEEFRFHMTLTGPLPEGDRAAASVALRELYAALDEPVIVDAITVMCQPARGARFIVLERIPLQGGGAGS